MTTLTIDVATLRELLAYDTHSGALTWRKKTAPQSTRIRVGAIAGCVDREGYRVVSIFGKRFYSHRVAWAIATGGWPNGVIDHKDGDKSNNRLANLRDATLEINAQNKRVEIVATKSGVRGAIAQEGRYRAMLKVGGKAMSLGTYSTPEESRAAYLAAKRLHHEGNTL